MGCLCSSANQCAYVLRAGKVGVGFVGRPTRLTRRNLACFEQDSRWSRPVQRVWSGCGVGHDTDHYVWLGTGARHVHRGHVECGRRAQQGTIPGDGHQPPVSSNDRRPGQGACRQWVFDVKSIGRRWDEERVRLGILLPRGDRVPVVKPTLLYYYWGEG